jgi:hypothetical protein
MKALTGAEFILKDYDTKSDYIEYLGLKLLPYEIISVEQEIRYMDIAYCEFISQEFKPDMIPEIFVGWKKTKHEFGILYCHMSGCQIDLDGQSETYTIFNNQKYCCLDIMNPKTIEMFISNWVQADTGIELTFKQGVNNGK